MHSLLETNMEDDVLFVQEPWFDRIGVERSDRARDGVDVHGGANHPDWELFYPYFTHDKRAKVMTYKRKQVANRITPLKVVPRLDLAKHPTILITDIYVHKDMIRVVNFYNDVDDTTSLNTLLSLDMDPTVPTLLLGDFNLHSHTWSPSSWERSTHAPHFEQWAATQTFSLQTSPGDITRRGTSNERPSTLDLTWHNWAMELNVAMTPPTLDWASSLGSDHCGIRSMWIHDTPVKGDKRPFLNTFKNNLDPSEEKKWKESLAAALPPITPILDATSLHEASNALQGAFDRACEEHMKHKRMPKSKGNRWWTAECRQASDALRQASADGVEEDIKVANANLKRVTKKAKREWADNIIEGGNVWEVARWRKGRKNSQITGIRTSESELTFGPEKMAESFADRFFAKDPGPIPTTFEDDPEPREKREWNPLTLKELGKYLDDTSDSSAPGNSGIAWWIIKLGWKVAGEHIQWVLNGSLSLGIHPDHWKTATVVVIPKPNRTDYFAAKNFRPISLLECLSKLLEKAVSKRLLFAIDKYELIPTTQFGTRAFSSTLDAGLTLMHDVQAAMRRKEKVGILLFDIKGFFDHVKRDRLKRIMENLGFPREYCEWAHSFLSDRKVRLSFNNFTSDEMGQPVGTPQGSPVSPVLSAIYTSALLRLQDHWNNSTLGMYVDDGVILAHADDWESVDRLLIARYRRCEEWLRRSNLAIEPDKTEVLYFRTPRQRLDFPPNRILLPNPLENTSYAVQASDTVRYLGFFINHKLDWEPHVTIMCNRARASIKALQVLGSSHRGLSMANWRLVFNAVCLPVLSYGCQLWANSPKVVSLMKKVQLVFNEGVKVISGAFRTAPREPLHEILRVLPARHFLEKLIHTSALRLYRVPRGSQLLSRLGHEWDSSVQTGTDWVLPGPLASTSRNGSGRSKQRPTALEALAARVPAEAPRTDVVAVAPWEVPDWGARCQLMGVTHPKQRKEWVDGLYSTITPSSGAIIRVASTVSNKGRPDNRVVGAAAAVLTQGGDRAELERSWCMGVEVTQFDVDVFALAKSAEWLASYYTNVVPPTDIYLLSGNHSALQFITKADSLVNQRAALLFKNSLSTFFSIQENRDTRFHLVWAPVSRKRAQDNKARAKVMEAILVAPLAGLNRVQSAAFLKRVARQKAYNNWLSEWNAERESRRRSNKTDHFAYGWSLITPPDGKNNPIWRGVVTIPAKSKGKIPAPSRHTTSTLLRFAVGHGFFSDYSTRFRKDLPDESHFCPCGSAPRTMMHLIYDCPRFQHIRNQRDFQVIDKYTPPDLFFTDPDVALIFAKFLSEGRVGFKPEEGPIVEFRDGRPSASSSRPRRPVPGGSAVPADPPEVMVSAPSLNSSAPFDPG
jgi:hypothetical protein